MQFVQGCSVFKTLSYNLCNNFSSVNKDYIPLADPGSLCDKLILGAIKEIKEILFSLSVFGQG